MNICAKQRAARLDWLIDWKMKVFWRPTGIMGTTNCKLSSLNLWLTKCSSSGKNKFTFLLQKGLLFFKAIIWRLFSPHFSPFLGADAHKVLDCNHRAKKDFPCALQADIFQNWNNLEASFPSAETGGIYSVRVKTHPLGGTCWISCRTWCCWSRERTCGEKWLTQEWDKGEQHVRGEREDR